jgi:antitoxin HigA-1
LTIIELKMMKSPFHPGRFLRELLSEHEISQAQLARHIAVSPRVINQICNERRGISAGLAMRLSHALGTTAEFWLNLQSSYELGRTDSKKNIKPLITVT